MNVIIFSSQWQFIRLLRRDFHAQNSIICAELHDAHVGGELMALQPPNCQDELIIAETLSIRKLDTHQWYGCGGGTDMVNEHCVDEVVRVPKVEQQQLVLGAHKYAQANRACRFKVGDGVHESWQHSNDGAPAPGSSINSRARTASSESNSP